MCIPNVIRTILVLALIVSGHYRHLDYLDIPLISRLLAYTYARNTIRESGAYDETETKRPAFYSMFVQLSTTDVSTPKKHYNQT